MSRVIHFEIAAENPERAQSFYADVFGWNIFKWDGPVDYWLAMTGEKGEPGIDGAIMHAREDGQRVVNTIDIEDLDATIAKIEAGGGKVVQPRMAVPGVGYMTYCQDTEGIVFGLMQADENAA